MDSVDLHARCWRETLADFGHALPYTRILEEIGKGADQFLAAILPAGDQQLGARIEAVRAERFRRQYLPLVRPFPQTTDLFARLRADGVRIVLASSARREEAEYLAGVAGVDSYVEAVISAEDAAETKPSPDIFLSALSRWPGIDHDDILAIGDTPYDIEAARKAGLKAIGLLSGPFDAARLRRAGAVALFEDVGDLLARYRTWVGTPEIVRTGESEEPPSGPSIPSAPLRASSIPDEDLRPSKCLQRAGA